MDYLSPGSSGSMRRRKPPPPPKGIGLGDVVAAVTRATGLDKVAKVVARATGRDCGCHKRRKALNRHRIHGRK